VWEREPVADRIAEISSHHARRLDRFRGRPQIREVRQTGAIAAIELNVPDAGYLAALGPKLNAFYLSHDVLLRSLGNVVYVMPPYCTSGSKLDRIYDVVEESLALVGA
jgi:adenosylmethionine-8-amino-7-oxononanoate aminotransferase